MSFQGSSIVKAIRLKAMKTVHGSQEKDTYSMCTSF